MGRNGRTLAVLAAIGTVFALTPAAGAQEEVTPEFSGVGGTRRIDTDFHVLIHEGTCPGGPVSLTSPGFAGPVDLTTLRGRFGKEPGDYTATLKCKDTTKVGTDTFRLVEPPPPHTDPFLDKSEYEPGETINVLLERGYKCGKEAVSEGFAEPAQLKQRGTADQALLGQTTAGNTPGTYQATIKCLSWSVVNTFTVKAPPTTPGPTPPGRKPPIVKPKGAPDTGGGGTAAR